MGGGSGCEEVKEKSGFLNKNTAACKKKKKVVFLSLFIFCYDQNVCLKKKLENKNLNFPHYLSYKIAGSVKTNLLSLRER